MTASGSAWLAVTSAPTVESERPIRPLIGAGTRGVAQVDPRGFERGAVLGDGGLGLPRLGGGVGIVLLGDRLHLGQRLVAVGADLRRIGVARALATLACAWLTAAR